MLSYYMFPSYRKEEEQVAAHERFTVDEMAKVAFKYRQDQYKEFGDSEEHWVKYIDEMVHYMNHPEDNPVYGHAKITCQAGANTCWVTWRGEVAACGMGGGSLHDLSKESVKDAWKAIVEEVDQAKTSEKCAYCKYRKLCPVCSSAAYCETGDIAGTPEYLCAFAEKFAEYILEEYERIHKS